MSKQENNQADATWRGFIDETRDVIDSGEFAKLSGAAKAVWIVLARRADVRGCSYPSLPSISKDTGLNRTSVTRAINELQSAGLLDKQTGGSKAGCKRATNQYRLHRPGAPCAQSESLTRRMVQQDHAHDAPRTRRILHQRPGAKPSAKETHTRNPIEETQEEGKNSSSFDFALLSRRLARIGWGSPQRRGRIVVEKPELISQALEQFDEAVKAKQAKGEVITNKGGFFGGILKNLGAEPDDIPKLNLPSASTRDESPQDRKLRILQQGAILLEEERRNKTVNTQHTKVITNAATH